MEGRKTAIDVDGMLRSYPSYGVAAYLRTVRQKRVALSLSIQAHSSKYTRCLIDFTVLNSLIILMMDNVDSSLSETLASHPMCVNQDQLG